MQSDRTHDYHQRLIKTLLLTAKHFQPGPNPTQQRNEIQEVLHALFTVGMNNCNILKLQKYPLVHDLTRLIPYLPQFLRDNADHLHHHNPYTIRYVRSAMHFLIHDTPRYIPQTQIAAFSQKLHDENIHHLTDQLHQTIQHYIPEQIRISPDLLHRAHILNHYWW
jgi:hypothetical protein